VSDPELDLAADFAIGAEFAVLAVFPEPDDATGGLELTFLGRGVEVAIVARNNVVSVRENFILNDWMRDLID
jgi:hypothetical protein